MLRLSDPPAIIEFSYFSVFPLRRQLLADGPIVLGGRAFDVLMAPIEASGAMVSKDELLSRVWQGRIVEENRRGALITRRPAFLALHQLPFWGSRTDGVLTALRDRVANLFRR
jgi:hypothetical protein